MSGRGTMTSRATVSPNSMMRLDELALLVLDHLVLGGRLDDAEQLLLRHERALLQTLAGHEHVGQPDQAAVEMSRSGGNETRA